MRPSASAEGGGPLNPARPDEALVFPSWWLRAGVVWWVVTAVGSGVVVSKVHTSLPYTVRLMLVAALYTIPGLEITRLLVRRCHPSMRALWWRWLYAMRCFFVYGYLTGFVLVTRWLEGYRPGTAQWRVTGLLLGGFGLGSIVVFTLVIRDTVRHGLVGRDRSEVVVNLFLAAVCVSGPIALAANAVHRIPVHDALALTAPLRPLADVFGIGAGVIWCSCCTRVLKDTAGLRALSVDGVDLVAAVVALGAAPLLAVVPSVVDHGAVQWLTVPLLFLAVALPGIILGGVVLMARMPVPTRRTTGVWVITLLVLSTVDAWCQLAMALSGFHLPAGLLVLPVAVNFGFFIVVPLAERGRPVLGLERLDPQSPLRRWDLVPAVVAVGTAGLFAELLTGPGPSGANGLAVGLVLGLLVALGVARHYASLGEARRLHRRIRSMTVDLFQQSRVDPLTGLANRRALAERFPQLAASCARASRPLSVAMVDLDHFKRYNDDFGHVAGDQLLRAMARQLRGALRHEDIAARYGGEEFCLVLPGADPDQVVGLLQRLRGGAEAGPSDKPGPGGGGVGVVAAGRPEAASWGGGGAGPGRGRGRGAAGGDVAVGAELPFSVLTRFERIGRPEGVLPVTFSAGVTGWHSGETFDDVVRRADAACYAAKAAGRDRVVVDATTRSAHS